MDFTFRLPFMSGLRESAPPIIGDDRQQMADNLHGKYFSQALRGNVYHGSTAAAGVVVPISTTLTPTFSLWNPAGSGVNLELINVKVLWSATTAALGGLLWMYTPNAGSGISTTAPFVAFGSGTAANGLVGAGTGKARLASGGTTTLVAAATMLTNLGASITATTAATATGPGWQWKDDYDGSIILPPSTAIHLMASTAILITATISVAWAEVPVRT